MTKKLFPTYGDAWTESVNTNSYINNNSGILQHLLLIWSSTVFRIITKLRCITQISDLPVIDNMASVAMSLDHKT